MPLHKLAFRVTHRFNGRSARATSAIWRPISSGLTRARRSAWSCATGWRGARRSASIGRAIRTIQIFGQHNFWPERGRPAAGLDAIATLEGADNLDRGSQELRSGPRRRRASLGRMVAALYAEPIFVLNSNPAADPGRQQHDDGRALAPGCGSVRRPIWSARSRRGSAASPGVNQGASASRGAPAATLSTELLERLRHDARADRRRRRHERLLVHRLQHLTQIFLTPHRGTSCVSTLGLLLAHRRGGSAIAWRRAAAALAHFRRRRPAVVVKDGSTGGPNGATITLAYGRRQRRAVTIAVGQTVTFVNNDSRSHEMASNPHPAHTDCPSTNALLAHCRQARPSSRTLYTVARLCGFHDHLNPRTRRCRARSSSSSVGKVPRSFRLQVEDIRVPRAGVRQRARSANVPGAPV